MPIPCAKIQPQDHEYNSVKQELMEDPALRQRLIQVVTTESYGRDMNVVNGLLKIREPEGDGTVTRVYMILIVESGFDEGPASTVQTSRVKIPNGNGLIKLYITYKFSFLKTPTQDVTDVVHTDLCLKLGKTKYQQQGTCSDPGRASSSRVLSPLDNSLRAKQRKNVPKPSAQSCGNNSERPKKEVNQLNEVGPRTMDSNDSDLPKSGEKPQKQADDPGGSQSHSQGSNNSQGSHGNGSEPVGHGTGNSGGEDKPPPWNSNHDPGGDNDDTIFLTLLMAAIIVSFVLLCLTCIPLVSPGRAMSVSDGSCRSWRNIRLALNWRNVGHMLALEWPETQNSFSTNSDRPEESPCAGTQSGFSTQMDRPNGSAGTEQNVVRICAFGFMLLATLLRSLSPAPRGRYVRHFRDTSVHQIPWKTALYRRRGVRRLRLSGPRRSRRRRWADVQRLRGLGPYQPDTDAHWFCQSGVYMQCFEDLLLHYGQFRHQQQANGNNRASVDSSLPFCRSCVGIRLWQNITLWAHCDEDLQERGEDHDIGEERDIFMHPETELRLRQELVIVEEDEENEDYSDEEEVNVVSLAPDQVQPREGSFVIEGVSGSHDPQNQQPERGELGVLQSGSVHSVAEHTTESEAKILERAVGGVATAGRSPGGTGRDQCVVCKAQRERKQAYPCGHILCDSCSAKSPPPRCPACYHR